VCHQSVGLIARAIERLGIRTVTLSSARSITEAVQPPRSVYLDYPLGRTAGRAHDKDEQMAIVKAALTASQEITVPGSIIDLPFSWQEDDTWKASVMRPTTNTNNSILDDRVERHATPQYQTTHDEQIAQDSCSSCIFLEPG